MEPQGPGSTPWGLDFIQGRGLAGGGMSSEPRPGGWWDTRSGAAQVGVVPGLAFRDLGAPEGYPTAGSNYCMNCHPGRSRDLGGPMFGTLRGRPLPQEGPGRLSQGGGRPARSLTTFRSVVWLCL